MPSSAGPAGHVDSALDTARFGRFHLTVAALCALVAGLDGFDTQAIAYVAPSITAAWDVAPAALGAVFSAGLIGLTVGAFLLGPLADRIGRRRVILGCVAAFGILSLATALATDVPTLIACRFLTGIGLGGAMPNLIALTSEYAPRRYKATLVTVMFCGFPLGSTLGGLVSAPLIEGFGWASVFLLGGVLPLALMPVLVFALPESLRFLARRPDAEGRVGDVIRRVAPDASADAVATTLAVARAGPAAAPSPVAGLFREGRARTTAHLWTAFFMNLLVMYFLVNWLPSLLRASGLPLGVAVLSTAILNFGGVVGAIALGRLIDRRNPYPILAAAYAASALFIGVLATAGANVPLLLIAAGLAGVGVVGSQIGLNAVTADYYPPEMRATGIGWALGVGRVGSIVGPVMGGALLAAGWSTQALILAATIPAAAAAISLVTLRRPFAARGSKLVNTFPSA